MSRYIRSFVPGATYFFTVTLADRTSDLLVREVDALRRAYASVTRRHPVDTLAICVLPDHLHAVWRLPPDDADFALRWQQIKRGFSQSVEISTPAVRIARREKGVWQRRYWEHQVRDDLDLARHVDYIHFNAVKHGHARTVHEWPYSSFHRWVEQGDLPAAWGDVRAADDDGSFGE